MFEVISNGIQILCFKNVVFLFQNKSWCEIFDRMKKKYRRFLFSLALLK